MRDFWNEVVRRVDEHRPHGLAAEIAFWFLLALQPFLIVCLALVAYLPLAESTQRFVDLVRETLPGEIGQRLASIASEVLARKRPDLLSVAILALVWTASSPTKALMVALRTIDEIEERRSYLRTKLVSIWLTVVLIGLAAVGTALAGGALHVVRGALGFIGEAGFLLRAAEVGLGLAFVATAVRTAYRFGAPNGTRPRRTWPGAIAATLAWVAASTGVSLYASHVGNLNAVYGAAGAAMLLVLWSFAAGFCLVIGAEVNSYVRRRSQRRDDESLARARCVAGPSLTLGV